MEKTEMTVDQMNEQAADSDYAQCAKELNEILAKYNYALVPFVEPRVKLLKAKKPEDVQQTTTAEAAE